MKKTNYFYIDEAGSLGNNSNFFIHGCIKTDNSLILENALSELKGELIDEPYFEGLVERIKQEGFHAVANHPDIRAQVYMLLPRLDYRSYFVILDKTSDYYKNLIEQKKEYEIFEYTLLKLLRDRVIKNKAAKNIFYFERINIKKKALIVILNDFFSSFDSSFDNEYYIVGKEENNIAVVDYLNHVLFKILNNLVKVEDKKQPKVDRMKLNFNLIKSKIGVINILHSNIFLSRKKDTDKQIEYEYLINEFGGKLE